LKMLDMFWTSDATDISISLLLSFRSSANNILVPVFVLHGKPHSSCPHIYIPSFSESNNCCCCCFILHIKKLMLISETDKRPARCSKRRRHWILRWFSW
jgi:hypothetical protein